MSEIKIRGMSEIRRALKKLPQELRATSERAALREGAKEILTSAKAKVAVDTGNLRKALGVSVRVGKRGGGYARVGARSGVKYESKKGKKTGRKARAGRVIHAEEYAWYLEHGTAKQAANPFMRPAVETSKGRVVEAMSRGLDKGLTRAVNKLKSKR